MVELHYTHHVLQNTFDTRRTGANETMLGAAQEAVLARDTNAAATSGVNQTVWQQYLGGLVMQVSITCASKDARLCAKCEMATSAACQA